MRDIKVEIELYKIDTLIMLERYTLSTRKIHIIENIARRQSVNR